MEKSRREFLKGTAWMGVAAMAAGHMAAQAAESRPCSAVGAPMHGFRVAPMKRVRVGVIGVGSRGTPAVHRIAQIPGCEVTAISDINPARLDAVQKEAAPIAAVGGNPPAERKDARAGDGRLDRRRLAGIDHAAAEAQTVRGPDGVRREPVGVAGRGKNDALASDREDGGVLDVFKEVDTNVSRPVRRNRNSPGREIHGHAVRVARHHSGTKRRIG